MITQATSKQSMLECIIEETTRNECLYSTRILVCFEIKVQFNSSAQKDKSYSLKTEERVEELNQIARQWCTNEVHWVHLRETTRVIYCSEFVVKLICHS